MTNLGLSHFARNIGRAVATAYSFCRLAHRGPDEGPLPSSDLSGKCAQVLNNEQLSPEREMVQDLLTIVHCFSARLYGLRNYRNTLTEVLAEDVK